MDLALCTARSGNMLASGFLNYVFFNASCINISIGQIDRVKYKFPPQKKTCTMLFEVLYKSPKNSLFHLLKCHFMMVFVTFWNALCVDCGWQYLQVREAVLEEDVPVVEEKLFLANTQQASHQGIQRLRRNRTVLASWSWSYFESQTFLRDWVSRAILKCRQMTGRVEHNESRKQKDAGRMVMGEGRKKGKKKIAWHNHYQRMLLSGTEVKCRLVKHLHKIF